MLAPLALIAFAALPQGSTPLLEIEGTCPGTLTVRVQGLTPGGTVLLGFSPSPGSATVAGGPCAGTQLGLEAPSKLLEGTVGGDGMVTATVFAPEFACGYLLQAIDLSACAPSNVAVVPTGPPDLLQEKPGGGYFFSDPNQGGGAATLKLLQVAWGRLVDVHDVDTLGETNAEPIFRDFVIDQNVQTDDLDYRLESNAITLQERLVILRTFDPAEGDDGEFIQLLLQAESGLVPIQAKSDAPGTLPPFSLVARNAALVIQIDDLLDDSRSAQLSLPEDVRTLVDYPPTVPFQDKRLLFDANHGGLGSRAFHSTRVILDLTVSELEASGMLVPTGVNLLGLPASLTTSAQANVSVRIPSQTDFGTGQFTRLENLSGHGMSTTDSGPVDFSSPTLPVVRAMRSGNETDAYNGFLLDQNPPELVSGWPIMVAAATDNPAGEAGFDFLVDLVFTSPCQAQPLRGDVLELPGLFAEVSRKGAPPDRQGLVPALQIRVLSEDPVSAASLLGGGLFRRTYDPSLFPASLRACWLGFSPAPGVFPAVDVDPSSQVILRFNKPMDPESLKPFDEFVVQRVDFNPGPLDIVVGEIGSSADLRDFTYTPLLPFDHLQGSAESYFATLQGGADGITDLVGNALLDLPEQTEFFLDPRAPTESNGGVVLRFNSLDEIQHPAGVAPEGALDIRGQFLFDAARGLIQPRPVVRSAAIADRTQAVPGIMIPFAPGVQTPLSPLGSKLMNVWRYCDVGFSTKDESNHNLDVEGLNWSPVGAQVVTDFYPDFEMRLSHGFYLPDEHIDPSSLLPTKPSSGLTTSSFAANVLVDPVSPQEIVHAKGLGYVVNPVDLFLSSTGTFMMPYPLNRETEPADDVYYTWRDTAVQAEGGPNNNGIDLFVMEDVGLIPPDFGGQLATTGQVPSIGLPLLMEYRCYPTAGGVGLNAFDISLAINSSRLPAFRIFSAGGLNTAGQVVLKDPDLEDAPTGGFNPGSTPPGQTTPPNDNAWYVGQMDVISRVSRAHTIWIDTEQSGGVTDFLDPVVEPQPDQQPAGTEVVLAYRGATGISGESFAVGKGYAFDAAHIDPYGDVRDFDPFLGGPEYLGTQNGDIAFFPVGDATWKDSIDAVDTARFFQVRITFVGDTTTLLNAELSALAIAYRIQ